MTLTLFVLFAVVEVQERNGKMTTIFDFIQTNIHFPHMSLLCYFSAQLFDKNEQNANILFQCHGLCTLYDLTQTMNVERRNENSFAILSDT
jgi:hypothetical protein